MSVIRLSNHSWKRGIIKNQQDEPKKCVANVLHVLSEHPEWAGVICYDAFNECIVKRSPPPVRAQDGVSFAGEWTESDSTRTAAWFATEIGFEPNVMHVDQAVAAAAERNTVHPVRDYLNSVKWDGVARLDTVLAMYFGATDTEYTRAVGARWVISAVARVMKPGCQADCMIVLESELQGIGKSTGFEALFGQAWFADTGISIGDKDSYQSLRGKWGYEFGELDAIKGREVTRVKNFVSARSDTYRPSYGKRTRSFPRQIVFCGTTNETEYLVDSTGNRRFWPVRCERAVDVLGLRRDRDQLWAEATLRFAQGAAWHVDSPELRALCEEAQKEREVEDAWTQTISKWLDCLSPPRKHEGISTADVMDDALKLDRAHMKHGEQTRVGRILKVLGWRKQTDSGQVRRDGKVVRLYYPPCVTAVTPEHATGAVTQIAHVLELNL